uniref:Uncharacterized protein n=1 Tax=Hyaloperonospora arabidopsidis (strain Emoy2) TaxID=559515 RepID=M4BYS5_HYAAE
MLQGCGQTMMCAQVQKVIPRPRLELLRNISNPAIAAPWSSHCGIKLNIGLFLISHRYFSAFMYLVITTVCVTPLQLTS